MGKKIVLTLSFVVAAAAFAADVFFRRTGTPTPLWDKVAMAYGGVFCVFWFFDTAGKKVSNKFAADAEEPERPTPRSSADPRQRPILAGGSSRSESQKGEVGTGSDNDDTSVTGTERKAISLERVRTQQLTEWQGLLDCFAEEILALDGVHPELNEAGHAKAWIADKLLNQPGTYCFWIQYHGKRVGTVVAKQMETHTGPAAKAGDRHDNRGDDRMEGGADDRRHVQLQVVYVASAWRRRGIGRDAIKRLSEFLLLLHVSCALRCELSINNYRGRSYLQGCGFQLDSSDTGAAASKGEASSSDESWQHWLRVMS